MLSSQIVSTLLRSNDRLVEMMTGLKSDLLARYSNDDFLREIRGYLSEGATSNNLSSSKQQEETASFDKHDKQTKIAASEKCTDPKEDSPPAANQFFIEFDQQQEPIVEKVAKSELIPEVKTEALNNEVKAKVSNSAKFEKEDEVVRVNLSRIELLNDYVGELIVLQSVIQQQALSNQSAKLLLSIQQMVKLSKGISGLKKLTLIFIAILVLGILAVTITAWIFSHGIINRLQGIIASLEASSKKVLSASASAEASAATLSEAATEQASSLQETMALGEEISAMINQNAESASKAKQTVEDNDKATKDGSRAVVDMVSAIGEIKTTNEQILQQMELSNREFGEIVQIISEIADKTKVINDIVFQTKLLSFASVEAARAGEHGKGFAVVAEEVGNLAQMSGNAAKEITDMLSASIKRVNGIVDQTKSKVEQLVEIGKDKVAMGQSTSERCRSALEVLSKNASTLTAMVTEIAHASKEQAQGVKEINSAISQLDQVTQQNTAVAQQSSGQAEALLDETGQLDAALNQLVLFVDGRLVKIKEAEAPLEQKARVRARGVNRDQASSSAPVVSIKSYKKASADKRSEVYSSGKHEKMASGSDITPKGNHPGFEDF